MIFREYFYLSFCDCGHCRPFRTVLDVSFAEDCLNRQSYAMQGCLASCTGSQMKEPKASEILKYIALIQCVGHMFS